MKRKIPAIIYAFAFAIGVMFLASVVMAEQPTQNYAKIYMNPLYNIEMDNDVWYDYTLVVETPDGISQVDSAMLTLTIWLNPTVIFDLEIDDGSGYQTCNNPQYQVHTTFAGAGEGTIFFACENIITGEGTYDVRIRASKDTGASTFFADLTYINNPKGEVEVHGTEYFAGIGQIGKVWLQLINSTGDSVQNGICYTDIYTPDGNVLIDSATMTNQMENGIYYYDLTIEAGYLGVYPAIAECYYESMQEKVVASSYVVDWGKTDAGILSDTYILDGTYLKLKTSKDGGTANNRINATFTFDDYYSSCGAVSEELMNGITWYWAGEWNTGSTLHDIWIYTFNYTSNSWITLPNEIGGGNGGTDFVVTNSISTNNITTALGISATNDMLLRFVDTDFNEGGKDFKNDYIYISCDQLSNPEWQEIKGSSELHVTPNIWTDEYSLNRTLSNFNFTVNTTTNSTELVNEIWSYNGTVNPNLISQFATSIWNFANRVLTFFDYETQSNYVWNDSNRTLTDAPFDPALIADATWNYGNRNLTYTPDQTNYTLTADSVWSENNSKYIYGTIIP